MPAEMEALLNKCPAAYGPRLLIVIVTKPEIFDKAFKITTMINQIDNTMPDGSNAQRDVCRSTINGRDRFISSKFKRSGCRRGRLQRASLALLIQAGIGRKSADNIGKNFTRVSIGSQGGDR